MPPAVRIAVLGLEGTSVRAELTKLPTAPDVRAFSGLYEDSTQLFAFAPDVLFLAPGDSAAETAGAVRLLRSLRPGLGVVFAVEAARELEVARQAQRLAATLLLLPPEPGAVASALEHALTGSDRPREDVFLDLARGVADEVNNPLMYVSGHLQLLDASLDPNDRDRRDQLRAAQAGVQRIHEAVERVRLLARAAAGPRRLEPVPLAAAVRAAAAAAIAPTDEAPSGRAPLALTIAPDVEAATIDGDPELLPLAFRQFCQVAAELQDAGSSVELELTRTGPSLCLRLAASGPGIAAWRLQRSFEPYALNRVLRGTRQGLALFFVQTVILAHRGQALARRRPDGSLTLDLLL